MIQQVRRTLRCATYTRKTSEEGLNQAFNSLQAQREACESYIASQRHEGWRQVSGCFDDGGLSGGHLDRPALQRLLQEIDAGRIDLVVVYKIDRLTRSLTDFAKLVDRFDAASCSFVSVTQSFNTSTSMGRLTLNVLLSFAQFEREVTAERIRDKIAASKQKGYWMGGLPPLSYDRHPDPKMQTLVINEVEAVVVRDIFELYKTHGCLRKVEQDVIDRDYRSKRRTYANGKSTGNRPFRRGQINFLLRNPIYIGLIRLKQKTFEGVHPPIVDQELWSDVQNKLDQKSPKKLRGPSKSGALLTGRVIDETGDALTPTHAQKAKRRYRYYVSARMLSGMASDPIGWRIPARPFETTVAEATLRYVNDVALRLVLQPTPTKLRQIKNSIEAMVGDAILQLIERVQVRPRQLDIVLSVEALATLLKLPVAEVDQTQLHFQARFNLRRRGNEARLILDGTPSSPDQKLIRMLALAHAWLDEIKSGVQLKDIAARNNWSSLMVRQRIKLAFLSPRIVQVILEGRQPDDVNLTRLITSEVPLDWNEQWIELGFETPAEV